MTLQPEVLPTTPSSLLTPDYIYPGAFVQLRDGSKATIYATDGGGAYPIHGATQHTVIQWVSDGTYIYKNPDDCPADIVGPWVEPPVEIVGWALVTDENELSDTWAYEEDARAEATYHPDWTVVKLTGTLPARTKS